MIHRPTAQHCSAPVSLLSLVCYSLVPNCYIVWIPLVTHLDIMVSRNQLHEIILYLLIFKRMHIVYLFAMQANRKYGFQTRNRICPHLHIAFRRCSDHTCFALTTGCTVENSVPEFKGEPRGDIIS